MNLKQWLATSVVLAIVTVFLVTVALVAFKVGPKYEFQEAVHGHIDNAYSSPTPELMKENMQLARTGMVELGLTPDMYGRLMPWKQTPEWRMDYQYARLDAILERCDEVIAWRDTQDLTSGQIVDVYREKMDTVRDLISDGGSVRYSVDYLAYRAYMIENHPFLYLYTASIAMLLGTILVSAVINLALLDEICPRRTYGKERGETRFDKGHRWGLVCVHTLIWGLLGFLNLVNILGW